MSASFQSVSQSVNQSIKKSINQRTTQSWEVYNKTWNFMMASFFTSRSLQNSIYRTKQFFSVLYTVHVSDKRLLVVLVFCWISGYNGKHFLPWHKHRRLMWELRPVGADLFTSCHVKWIAKSDNCRIEDEENVSIAQTCHETLLIVRNTSDVTGTYDQCAPVWRSKHFQHLLLTSSQWSTYSWYLRK